LFSEVGPGDEKMTSISKSRVMRASLDTLWGIVSDVDNEPKYYDGLKSVKNLSKVGNVVEREVVVGYLKHEGRQTVTLDPKKSVEVKMTKGPMIGTRLTTLSPMADSNTRVDVSWRIEFSVPAFVRGMVKREVEKGTENALDRIAREAESG
jgi:ribosome-associated toxin RatA of RatAB toxin-antitoxin module